MVRRILGLSTLLPIAALIVSGCAGGDSPDHRAAQSITTTPRTEPCVLQHAPDDLYSLEQPVSIALPSGGALPIVPGNPITQPGGVTLDGDGAYPGKAGTAASLLWDAATERGPFSGLDHSTVGTVMTLRQTLHAGGAGDCIQHWRIVRISGPLGKRSTEPTLLRLVGFIPNGGGGPTVQFYVDAIPA